MAFVAKVKVRFADVDNAGIVYYPYFFHFFHVAFEEFFSECLEMPYDRLLREEKIGFPSVHVESDFKKPLHFGQTAAIEVGIERVGTKSGTFVYTLRVDGSPEVCAKGKVTVACVDMNTFEAIEIPEPYRSQFKKYQKTGAC